MSQEAQSDIAQLCGQIDQIEDPRECYALVQERIRTYRSSGNQVPDVLSNMERQFFRECLEESQGR